MAFDRSAALGTPEFNSAATGSKLYGVGRGNAATSGALSSDGYNERARKQLARKRAIQNRLAMTSSTPNVDGTIQPGGNY
jgi:hypothetical protein